MELAVSTGIFYDEDAADNLAAIRIAGFRRVELCVGDRRDGRARHYDWKDPSCGERLCAVLSGLGLSVCTVHAPYSPLLDPAHPDPAPRRAALEEAQGVARQMKSLGARILVVHVAVGEFDLGDRRERSRRLDNVRRFIPAILEVLRPLGIRLALENLLPHLLGGDVGTLLELLEPYPAAEAGICFDTSHANLCGDGAVYGMLEKSLPRLLCTHLSDNRGRFDDHFLPGEGGIDWGKVMKLLKESGYDGPATFEVFRDSRGSPAAEVLRSAYRKGLELAG